MPSDGTILIVDDHEETVFALESTLAPLGLPVARATSGEQALKEILRGRVGVVLLDVRMPHLGGLDVLRYLRGLEQTQDIPVLLLTGFGPVHDVSVAAFELGAADVVAKPVDPWLLRIRVRHLRTVHQRLRRLRLDRDRLRASHADRGTGTGSTPAHPHPASTTAPSRHTVAPARSPGT